MQKAKYVNTIIGTVGDEQQESLHGGGFGRGAGGKLELKLSKKGETYEN